MPDQPLLTRLAQQGQGADADQAGPEALLSHVKLPRTEVRKLLWALVLSGVSDRQLQRSWDDGLSAPGPLGQSARIGT